MNNEEKFEIGDRVEYVGNYSDTFKKGQRGTVVNVKHESVEFEVDGLGGETRAAFKYNLKNITQEEARAHEEHIHVCVPSAESGWGTPQLEDLKEPPITPVLDALNELSRLKLQHEYRLEQLIRDQERKLAEEQFNVQLAVHEFIAAGNQPATYKLFVERSEAIEALAKVIEVLR